jgi:hypothetical protein
VLALHVRIIPQKAPGGIHYRPLLKTLEIVQVGFCPRSQNHLEWHGVDPCYKDLATIRLVLKILYETAKKKEMIQGIDP